jgi:hypothetical protein
VKPDAADILIFLGLILLGVGLFFWFGLGVALAVDGAVILIYGMLAKAPLPHTSSQQAILNGSVKP